MPTTVTSFPFSKHIVGSGATPEFSGQHVYLQFTWEEGLLPSPVEFSSHCHFYKFSRSWWPGRCRRSSLLWPACLFTVLWGIAPLPCFAFRAPHLLCYMSFLKKLFIIQFVFYLGWGLVCQGAMLIWPRVISGSTTCHLAHQVVCFSQAC
jgi:hypothetical protein